MCYNLLLVCCAQAAIIAAITRSTVVVPSAQPHSAHIASCRASVLMMRRQVLYCTPVSSILRPVWPMVSYLAHHQAHSGVG